MTRKKPNRSRNRRPILRVELGALGPVDPFSLSLVEDPEGSGEFTVEDPAGQGGRIPVEVAGLNLVGAAQALMSLSCRWLGRAGRELEPGADLLRAGETRMVMRRREARLLAALLRRHLDRLPEPPTWMGELLGALEQIDEFLRWEEI